MKQIQSIAALFLLALSACSPKVDNRGYVSDASWKDNVTIGTTTKQDIINTFGSPSSQSSFGAETWYYVSARKETVAFFETELAAQDTVRVEFDAAGVVSSVSTFDKESGKNIALTTRTTPTEGHSLNFFEQVMGNLGRFNKPGSNDTLAPGRRPGRGGF